MSIPLAPLRGAKGVFLLFGVWNRVAFEACGYAAVN